VRVLEQLPDGTVRQQSPLTGTVVWTVPGRSNRPIPSALPVPRPLSEAAHETCAFCPERYLETPPECSRLVLDPRVGGPEPWRIRRHLAAEELTHEVADFRRFPNLFEILPFDYWHLNHGYQLPAQATARARDYVATPAGRAHVLAIKRTRMGAAGASAERVATEPEDRLLARAGTLFASSHDVVAARRHFVEGATTDDELASSGDLTPTEHHAFLALTVDALADMNRANPFAHYVAAFQNWLRPAGASFDHLHKQLVAIDEYGPLMTRIQGMLRDAPDLFNTTVADPAVHDGLVIAENEHAIALAGVGHRYPTVEILATGTTQLPWEHPPQALRAVSDVLHACHAATGRLVPTNEEWHYRPVDAVCAMPWRINLKWRVSTLAGFEGGTKINVNTISPFTLRERMVDSLVALRSAGRIEKMAIGDECSHRTGALGYAG
jgi:galactose-1-phosphate uridylyltransferase